MIGDVISMVFDYKMLFLQLFQFLIEPMPRINQMFGLLEGKYLMQIAIHLRSVIPEHTIPAIQLCLMDLLRTKTMCITRNFPGKELS